MLNKMIVVINGKGGAGKDTLCASFGETHKVMNVSAIDPIKEIARQHGWNGEKDDAARRFLAELKRAFVNYNDLPTEYLKQKTAEFLSGSDEVLFVHIREADQIEAYKRAILPNSCITLLVKRDAVEHDFGNEADDDVLNYTYDLVFDNNIVLEESAAAFSALLEKVKGSR